MVKRLCFRKLKTPRSRVVHIWSVLWEIKIEMQISICLDRITGASNCLSSFLGPFSRENHGRQVPLKAKFGASTFSDLQCSTVLHSKTIDLNRTDILGSGSRAALKRILHVEKRYVAPFSIIIPNPADIWNKQNIQYMYAYQPWQLQICCSVVFYSVGTWGK